MGAPSGAPLLLERQVQSHSVGRLKIDWTQLVAGILYFQENNTMQIQNPNIDRSPQTKPLKKSDANTPAYQISPNPSTQRKTGGNQHG